MLLGTSPSVDLLDVDEVVTGTFGSSLVVAVGSSVIATTDSKDEKDRELNLDTGHRYILHTREAI